MTFYEPSLFLYPLHILNNSKLTRIDFSQNQITALTGYLDGLPNLRYLDLSSNDCSALAVDFFKHLTQLRILRLRDNKLGSPLSRDLDARTFSSLSQLRTLDLSSNEIFSLPINIVLSSVHLNVFNVSFNYLRSFAPNLKAQLNMSFLDLSYNQLTGLTETNCRDLLGLQTRNPNFKVNLQGNNLFISCLYVPFLRLHGENPRMIENIKNLTLKTENETILNHKELILYLPKLEKACQMQTLFSVVSVFFFLLVGSVLFSSALYHNRWKLRYLYFIGRKRINADGIPVTFKPVTDCYITYDEVKIFALSL